MLVPHGHEGLVELAPELARRAEAEEEHYAGDAAWDELGEGGDCCGCSEVGLGGEVVFSACVEIL